MSFKAEEGEWETVDSATNDWEAVTTPEAEGWTDVSQIEKETDSQVLNNLPDTARTLLFGMKVPISKEHAAFKTGMGHLMTDVYRGIKQSFGIDEEQMKADQKYMDSLYQSEVGGWATTGAVVGALAEPTSILLPATKGKSVLKAMGIASLTGATYGGLGYVDKEKGQTRAGNAALGGTISPAFIGGLKGVAKIHGARKTRKADKLIKDVEHAWAEKVLEGKTTAQITKELSTIDPDVQKKLLKATELTGRKARFTSNTDEARDVVDFYTSTSKQNDWIVGADKAVGILSTRIRNISEAVFGVLRKYDYNVSTKAHNYFSEVDVFLKDYSKKITGDDKVIVDEALLNGDMTTVKRILTTHGGAELWGEYKKVASVLNTLGDELVKRDRITGKLENYFPRFVKDVDGLLSELGVQKRSKIEQALAEARDKAISSRGYPLSPLEETQVINKAIRGFPVREARPGFAKERVFEKIPKNLLKYYASPEESLHSYIRNAVHDIEKMDFFGRSIKYKDVNGIKMLDVDESVGEFVRGELLKKSLSPAQQQELTHLLSIRMGIGERSSLGPIQDIKNIMYAGLLGNPIAAATQLGDLGVSIYINGFRNTLKAVANQKVKMEDFGIVDHLAEEFATTRKSAAFLKGALKWSGFKAMDRLGKQSLINGSLLRHQKLATSEKGIAKIAKKYQKVFGEDFDQLVTDLKRGDMTENVKLLLFNELADVQPITLSEMPEMYLRLPNGRMMYMLKTFMLKQLDVVRRESYDEIKKGNTAKGLTNLMRYGLILGTTNTGSQYIKDWMLGKDVEPNLPADIGVNLFKTFGWSEYVLNKFKSGQVAQGALDIVIPPFNMFDKVWQTETWGGEKEYDVDKALQYMPVGGKMWYYWFGGGLEKWEKQQKRYKD